jgi:RNA recognition motif-containing protein
MGNRLYVGNLSYSTTREALEAAFATAGEVREIAMPTDRETGQPRGFAFVTMGSASAATNAISQLNGMMLDGRTLKVNEAQERPPRDGGGGGGRSFGGGGGGGFGGGGGGGGRGGYGGGGGGGRGGRGGGGRDRY